MAGIKVQFMYDPSPNEYNNALYLQLSDICYKLAKAPLYSKAQLILPGLETCHPQKGGLAKDDSRVVYSDTRYFPGVL